MSRRFSSRFPAVLAAALLLMGGGRSASAQTITFEGSWWGANSIQVAQLPNGYSGLRWTDFWVIDRVYARSYAPNFLSGYERTASFTNSQTVGFNAGGGNASLSSDTPFDFGSAVLAAAFRTGMTVQLTAFDALGNVVGNESYSVSTAPRTITPNFTGVSRVSFSSFGGTVDPGAENVGGVQFALDNVVLKSSTVPEPSSFALAAAGVGALLLLARRRRR